MPEPVGRVSNPVLLVRVVDVLDRTREGRDGAAALEKQFTAARAAVTAMAAGPEQAAAEAKAVGEIESERARRRTALLERARAGAEQIRKQRGAQLVLDAGLALAFEGALDVTDELIAALDAAKSG